MYSNYRALFLIYTEIKETAIISVSFKYFSIYAHNHYQYKTKYLLTFYLQKKILLSSSSAGRRSLLAMLSPYAMGKFAITTMGLEIAVSVLSTQVDAATYSYINP